MRTFAPTALLALFLCPVAFGDSPKGSLPPGVWKSSGYGMFFRSAGNRVEIFETSPAGCVRGDSMSPEAFRGLLGNVTSADAQSFLERYPTRDLLEKATSLPAACESPVRGGDARRNLAVLTDTFAVYYPFFGQRGIEWNRATAEAQTKVTAGQDLFDVLVGLLKPLGDGHVSLEAGKRKFDPDVDWKSLRSSLRELVTGPSTPLNAPAELTGNRRVFFGRLSPRIGYLAILAEGGWAEGLTEASPAEKHVAAASALLNQIRGALPNVEDWMVDLRVNSGGFDAVSLEVVSRFVTGQTVVYRKHAHKGAPYDVVVTPTTEKNFGRGRVAVLIGPNTVSAGETMALAFSAIPHARLFGQTTRGILSDAIPRKLPNGWSFTLPMESTYSVQGKLVEVAGVEPAERTTGSGWLADIQTAKKWLESN